VIAPNENLKLLHIKGNNYQSQEKHTDWRKHLSSYSMNKRLIIRINKELKKLNIK
jgi:hypothetical protein